MRRPTRHGFITTTLAGALLAGCYMPGPQVHAELRIAADGSYRFNGQPVAAGALVAAISAAKPPSADLVVQIEPAPGADRAALRLAVEAVKSAHARVAFAKQAS